MRFFFPRNLRSRLIASLCIAIFPAMIFGSLNLFSQYNATRERYQQEATRLVRMAEFEYFQVIESTRQFLVLLSHLPVVADQDAASLNELFAELRYRSPSLTNISLATPEGERIACAQPGAGPESIAGRSWYKRLLKTRKFTIGEYRAGTINHKPGIEIGYPVNGNDGELKAILFADLDLNWFQELAVSLGLPEGWVLTLRDQGGAILARYPEGLKYVEMSVPEALIMRAIRENKNGLATSTGIDGVERIYAFTDLHRNQDTGSIYLSVGVPLSVYNNLLFWVVGHFLVLLLAFFGMALGSHLFILPNVRALTDATKQLRAGNLNIRTGLPHEGGEFGELAAAFDQMAQSLESKEDEQKRSREALLESEHRFRTIFDSVNDAILVLHPSTGLILDVNKRGCELSGYEREQLKGRGAAELSSGVEPYTGKEAQKWLGKAVMEGPQVFEWEVRNRMGLLFWAEVNLRGAVIGGKNVMLLTVRDVTRRKKAETALRQSESRYRAFVANSSEGIFRIELEKPIPISIPEEEIIERFHGSAYLAECSDEMARICGLERVSDMVGSRVSEFLSRSDPRNIEYLKSFIRSGYRLVEAESYRRNMNGGEICLSSSLIGVIENDRLVRAWGVQREITRQKKAEEKLRNLNRFNQEIISSARNGILVFDVDLNYVLWNRFMEEMTGLSSESVVGKSALDVFPPVREQEFLLKKALAGEHCRSGDIHYILPGARKEVWMIADYGPYFNTRGETIGVMGIVTDITERKAAEAQIERMNRRNRLILDAAGDGIIGMDRNGRCIFMNPASAEMLRCETDEIIGEDVHRLIRGASAECCSSPVSECTISMTLSHGSMCRITDGVMMRKDGGIFPVIFTSTPIVEEGEITGAVITFRDVTEQRKAEEARKRLEEQLGQAQKMEAIGALAGGIAHDFNNILTPIIGYCEMCLQEVTKGEGLYRKISQVLKSSLRAKELVSQILAFSRKGEQEIKPVQLSLIVKEALNFLRSSIPSTIEIRRRIDPEAASGKVLACPTRIHQIMINLCTNAAYAMGEKGGTLDVAVSRYEFGAGGGHGSVELDPGSYLKLIVSDTGHGIDEEIQHRIFEPYFTTKPAGEGTGLGLSVVYGIVKSLGGDISVTSEPGQGAVFEVLLPMAEVPAETAEDIDQNLPAGIGHILLVDDEPAIVEMQREMVEHLGYRATVKHGSLEALDSFRADPHGFDLIMTDQTMPHMTGNELAGEALKIRGDIPIILCTGFSETVDAKTAKEDGIRGFLMKPLSLRAMAYEISRVLKGEDQHEE